MLPSPNQNPELIAGFYEAAAQAGGWTGPWSALCAAFDADTGLLYRQSRPSAQPFILASRNWSQDSHGLPAGHYVEIQPTRAEASPRAPRTMMGEEIVARFATPPGRDAASTTIAAFDIAAQQPATAFHVLCSTVALDDGALIGMGLHRPLAAPRFTDADRLALDGVGRHVAAAVRLETMLAAERMASALRGAALDLYPHGIVLTNGEGQILFANQAAGRIAQVSGIVFGRGRAGISLSKPAEAAKLEALITSVGGGGSGGCTRVTRQQGTGMLAAIVEPLPISMAQETGLLAAGGNAQLHGDQAVVLITLRDLGATADASPSVLMDLFGLTAAEAGIVPQLLSGDSVSLIAQSRGAAVSTVKAQAGKVLAKTGAPNLRALSTMIAALGCG